MKIAGFKRLKSVNFEKWRELNYGRQREVNIESTLKKIVKLELPGGFMLYAISKLW